MGDINDYVTVAQAAEVLKLSPSRVKQFIAEKRLPSVLIHARQHLILRADVEAFAKLPRQKRGKKPAPKKGKKK